MIIQRELLYKGSIGEKRLHTLFDSGATISCIHPDRVQGVENPVPIKDPLKIGTASVGTFLEITHYVALFFELEGKKLIDVFVIIPNLNADVVIGVDTLQKYHCKLDFENGEIIIDPNAGKLLLM